MNIPVLIPAYNPDEKLLALIKQLLALGFQDIIIVNDGSDPASQPIFDKVSIISNCHVLHQAVNLGQGRSLKTGLNYYYLNYPNTVGVIQADADGQHTPEDIKKVGEVLQANADKLVLGTRHFDRNIPWKSLVGNVITRKIFQFLVGKNLKDTQSGLRGVPRQFVLPFIALPGERFEYNLEVLLATKILSINVLEEPITTIYLDDNRSSHFDPLLDSMRIYFLFLRFLFSSILASLTDFIVFIVCFKFTGNLIVSVFSGRFIAGSLVNYFINKKMVFRDQRKVSTSMIKYYILLTIMGTLSYLFIQVLNRYLGWPVIIAKIVVETLLFTISFTVQRDLIFIKRSPDI